MKIKLYATENLSFTENVVYRTVGLYCCKHDDHRGTVRSQCLRCVHIYVSVCVCVGGGGGYLSNYYERTNVCTCRIVPACEI